jgi:hypothetical protein
LGTVLPGAFSALVWSFRRLLTELGCNRVTTTPARATPARAWDSHHGVPSASQACLEDRLVKTYAAFFQQKLGFEIDFLHGLPPFYGAVSRDGVCLHIRYVRQPFFAQAAVQEKSLICASIEVSNVQGLFEEFKTRGVKFAQRLTKQAWGGTDFKVRDPYGNVISFVTYG